MTRDFYIPSNPSKVIKGDGYEIYYTDNGYPAARGFGGKRSAPDFNYRFRSEEEREKHVADYIARLDSWKATKEASAVARKARQRTMQVGDILYASWGYDQTNINFYQVTKLIGKTMVEVREINRKVVGGHSYEDDLMPIKDSFRGEPMRRSARGTGVSVSSCQWASPWDGKPKSQTALGYGH